MLGALGQSACVDAVGVGWGVLSEVRMKHVMAAYLRHVEQLSRWAHIFLALLWAVYTIPCWELY